MKKEYAFTIAECMITLAILSVVVILMLGSLKNSDNKQKIFRTSYDKICSDIETAAKAIIIDKRGTGGFKRDVNADNLVNDFASKLDIENIWNNADGWRCSSNDIVTSVSGDDACNNLQGIRLNNGMCIGFVSVNDFAGAQALAQSINNLNEVGNPRAGVIKPNRLVGAGFIDVNCTNSPNKAGEDQYVIPIYTTGTEEISENVGPLIR